jgi:hypothetical protein
MAEFTGDVEEALAKTCKTVKCTFEDGMLSFFDDRQYENLLNYCVFRNYMCL